MTWNEGHVGHVLMSPPAFDGELVYVYVAWGADREHPLYVGKSKTPLARLGSHSDRARWYPEAVEFELFAFRSEVEALTAESLAIVELRPTFNVMGHRYEPVPPFTEPVVEYRRRVRKPHKVHPPAIESIKDIPASQLAIVARVQNRGRA